MTAPTTGPTQLWTPALQPGWLLGDDELPDIQIYAGPLHDGFLATLVVGHSPRPLGDLRSWNDAATAELRARIPRIHVLDEVPDTVDGCPAIMRVAVYAEEQHSLTLVQWSWFDENEVITATGTSLTRDHAPMATIFASMVRHGKRSIPNSNPDEGADRGR